MSNFIDNYTGFATQETSITIDVSAWAATFQAGDEVLVTYDRYQQRIALPEGEETATVIAYIPIGVTYTVTAPPTEYMGAPMLQPPTITKVATSAADSVSLTVEDTMEGVQVTTQAPANGQTVNVSVGGATYSLDLDATNKCSFTIYGGISYTVQYPVCSGYITPASGTFTAVANGNRALTPTYTAFTTESRVIAMINGDIAVEVSVTDLPNMSSVTAVSSVIVATDVDNQEMVQVATTSQVLPMASCKLFVPTGMTAVTTPASDLGNEANNYNSIEEFAIANYFVPNASDYAYNVSNGTNHLFLPNAGTILAVLNSEVSASINSIIASVNGALNTGYELIDIDTDTIYLSSTLASSEGFWWRVSGTGDTIDTFECNATGTVRPMKYWTIV